REKMSLRGAGEEEGGNLSLLPEMADSSAAKAAAASKATPSAAPAAAAAAAAADARDSSESEDEAPARGRRSRGWGRNRESGRGVTMGHATMDAPDLRLGELERLFQV